MYDEPSGKQTSIYTKLRSNRMIAIPLASGCSCGVNEPLMVQINKIILLRLDLESRSRTSSARGCRRTRASQGDKLAYVAYSVVVLVLTLCASAGGWINRRHSSHNSCTRPNSATVVVYESDIGERNDPPFHRHLVTGWTLIRTYSSTWPSTSQCVLCGRSSIFSKLTSPPRHVQGGGVGQNQTSTS